jgi:hypothetical protein
MWAEDSDIWCLVEDIIDMGIKHIYTDKNVEKKIGEVNSFLKYIDYASYSFFGHGKNLLLAHHANVHKHPCGQRNTAKMARAGFVLIVNNGERFWKCGPYINDGKI